MAPNQPDKIGQYEILDVIGRGGMGVVYKAKDPFLNCLVAIKMMTVGYGESADLRQRFYREAQSTANLRHPNIVTVHGGGELEGNPYLVMEFLEGASLEALLRAHADLTLLQKVTAIVEVCHGLAYAHQRGIVHRDIKPANIMLLKDGQIKLVDFGIAHIGDKSLTKTGQIIGSLNYMSPEQIQGHTVDQRSDIFSTGVVLYQLLADMVPFEAESTAATMMKIIGSDPPPPFPTKFPFSAELQAITFKALAKRQEERYHSADDLALDLSEIQEALKRESITDHLREAERLLESKDLLQAQEQLVQVLKIDRQNTDAASRLRLVRKQIQFEQSTERVRQLKEMAEEAYRREDFDSSLNFLHQAVALDNSSPDLRALLNGVEKAKLDAEFVRRAMARADAAKRSGDLDSAIRALDEALALKPDDTKVKAVRRIIEKEALERQLQKQVNTLLDSARREMESRRHTAALDLLKQVEKLDPSAPQLRPLMEKLLAAHQQEKKRKELEGIHRTIEDALNRDQFDQAASLASEALQRFPGDTNLLNMKELAESQGEAQRRKTFVREQLAAIQAMLDAGNTDAAEALAQSALSELPGDPNLESMLDVIRERLSSDQTDSEKEARIQQAKDALARKDFAEAIRILENTQLRFADTSGVDELLRFAREQSAKKQQQERIDQASRRSQQMLAEHDYDGAVQFLESVLRDTPNENLTVVLQNARRKRDDFERNAQVIISKARKFVSDGVPAKAREFLEAQAPEYSRHPNVHQLLETIRNMPVVPPQADVPAVNATVIFQSRPQTAAAPTPAREVAQPRAAIAPDREAQIPGPPPVEQRSRIGLIIAVAVVLVVIVGGLAIWRLTSKPAPQPGEVVTKTTEKPITTATILVKSNVPDADVLVDGQLTKTTGADGTVTVTVDLGQHEVVVQKSGYEVASPLRVDASSGSTATVSIDLAKAVQQGGETIPKPDSYLIVSSTAGAELLVDGRFSGIVPNHGTVSLKVNPGKHRVDASLAGYDSRTANVTVKDGDRLQVAAELRPKPAPQQVQPQQQQPVKVAANTNPPPPTASTPAPKPASIKTFDSGSDKIQRGSKTKLFWATDGATAVSIDPGIGSVGADGSREVSPDRTTTYVLTATGSTGTPMTKSLVITVEEAPAAEPVRSSQSDPIDATIEHFRQQYQTLSLDALLSVWPSMPKKKQNDFKDAFKEFRALQLAFSNCNRRSTGADTVEVSCSMKATYTSKNGKLNPPQTTTAKFSLKKSGSGYNVLNVE